MTFIDYMNPRYQPREEKKIRFLKRKGKEKGKSIKLYFNARVRREFGLESGLLLVLSHDSENIFKWKVRKLNEPNVKAYTLSSKYFATFTFQPLFDAIKTMEGKMDYEIIEDAIYFTFPKD